MPIIPFIGSSYTLQSPNFDCQRSVNLYLTKSEKGDSKSSLGMQGTPGLSLFCTVPSLNNRGSTVALNRGFTVFSNTLYELYGDGSFVSRGTLNTSTGFVSMANNGKQVCIVDGPNGYIFDLTDGTFTQITDDYFLGANTVNFIDGYFMFNKPDSQIYYISALYDGTTGDPLDFASAEGSPDGLVGIATVHQQPWLFGTDSIEIAANTGDALFPFTRVSGAVIEYGCAAANSIATTANTVFWLGRDEYGAGVVWMAEGYQPRRVSTYAIEYAIQQYGDLSDAIAYTYQEDGHYFYVLNFTNANTTWVYDIGMGEWHERASFSAGQYNRARPQTHMFVFNKHLVGDYQNGNVYVQSLSNFTENGNIIRRMRTSQHLSQDLNYLHFSEFQIDMESGVGVQTGANQNTDPQVMLQWSDDGGHMYSNEHWRPMGKIGEYRTRVIWRRLGRSRDRVFKAVITSTSKVFIINAHAQIDKMRN